MTEQKTSEDSKPNPVEAFNQKEFRNIQIYRMHKDVVSDFVDWCKKYTDGKYSAGISLLLSKAKAFDLIAGVDQRIKALEQQVALLMQSKSVEEHSQTKPEIKTIGGN
jgi:hypothetical protein